MYRIPLRMVFQHLLTLLTSKLKDVTIPIDVPCLLFSTKKIHYILLFLKLQYFSFNFNRLSYKHVKFYFLVKFENNTDSGGN